MSALADRGFDDSWPRNPDGTIDLLEAWSRQGQMAGMPISDVQVFFREAQELRPIHSRQVAATLIATANYIARQQEAK